MTSLGAVTFSNFYPLRTLINSPATIFRRCAFLPSHHVPRSHSLVRDCSASSIEVSHDEEAKEFAPKDQPRLRWTDVRPDISAAQKLAIRNINPKMSNRCKALMRRIICFSPQDESLPVLLAFWVKAMKPRRADWLAVLKEMKMIESPLLTEVIEYALLEDSFEASVRDYTKLIHIYGKQNLLQKAEGALQAMRDRGFPFDQVVLTALIDMYSKTGDFTRAKEAFEEIKLLGLPLDKRAYGSMIMAYIRADMLNNADSLLKETEDREVYAGREVYKALLRAYSSNGDSDGAQRVFDAVQFAGIIPDSKLFALLVNAYCLSGQIGKARSVIENMRKAGVIPCDKCVALMLNAYEKENNLQNALAFLIELEENGILVGEEAAKVLAVWFSRLGVVHEVEQVLRDLEETGRVQILQLN